jgi:hypothetical protein
MLAEATMVLWPMPKRWCLIAVMALPACGSAKTSSGASPGPDSGTGSDPGSGTKTLYAGVELNLSALAGGATPSAELTVVLAHGTLGGASVSGANVALTAADGVIVTATEDVSVPGSYGASGFVWEPSWQVQISAASDQLEFTLTAPGATTITSPTQGASVAAGPVALEWTDAWGAKAENVWADCCGAPTVKLTDSGAGTISLAAPGGELTLYRQNALVPNGGATGSLATAETSYGVYLQTH